MEFQALKLHIAEVGFHPAKNHYIVPVQSPASTLATTGLNDKWAAVQIWHFNQQLLFQLNTDAMCMVL